MPPNIFKLPPLDRLTRDEAATALVNIGDDLSQLEDEFGKRVDPRALQMFIAELEYHPIMALGFNGMCMSSATNIAWLWHPKHACGILYDENDCFETPAFIAINKTSSKYLASKLRALMKLQDYSPETLEADEVELESCGIDEADLIRALANSVFASDPEFPDSAKAAADWVKRHSGKKRS
jgi:hypothetical protein